MRWWMRFPWTRWVQRLYDRWHGPSAHSSEPTVTISPSSLLAEESPPTPQVSVPAGGLPWDWGWLVGNGPSGPPAPPETISPGSDAGPKETNNLTAANTEAIDAVFANYTASSQVNSAGGDPSTTRPSEIKDSLSPPAVGDR